MADAEVLGLNAVSDGRHVVLPAQATGLAAQLATRGFEPIGVDLSELRKAGGGPKCCTLRLREGKASRVIVDDMLRTAGARSETPSAAPRTTTTRCRW